MTVASLRQSVRNNVWWGVRLPTVGKRQTSNAGPKPTRFVSAAGNDNNDGLTPATAWATITKVNAATLNSNDVVGFRGGDTFTGTITPQRDGTAAASLVFTSYGVGQATISSGTARGYYALNRSYVTADNLNCVGNGTTNNTYGLQCSNNQAGNTKLPGNLIQYCTATGYGLDGITMTGDNGTSGFTKPTILNSISYLNTFGNSAGNGSSGISIFSTPGYGNVGCHTNPRISGCIAHHNLGGADTTNWSGSGIFIGESTGGGIDNCIGHDNGGNSQSAAGPVGIWTGDSSGVIIQFCESYNNSTGVVTGADGGGFDLDGGCINCILQYNYSHDNRGQGFTAYAYNDGIVTTHSGCTIRFNISYNDGTIERTNPNNTGGILISADSPITGLNVYNNVVYQTYSAQSCLYIDIRAVVSANVGNNIFFHTGGGKQVRWANSGTPTIAMLGNCYYGPSGVSLDWKGTNYSTFAAWQTASGLEKISGSNVGITSNPQLSSPGTAGIMGGWNADRLAGYKPTSGSPCITGGVDLHAQFGLIMPANDLFGNANPSSAPYACGVTAHV